MPATVKCQKCGKNHFVGSKNYAKCQGKKTLKKGHNGKSTAAAHTASAISDFASTQQSVPITQTNLDVLEDYGIYRIMTETMHNSIDAFGEIEAYYYSTDTGQLELARREKNNPYSHDEISQMKASLDTKRDKRIPESAHWHDEYQRLADAGEDKIASHSPVDSRGDKEVQSYILRESLNDLAQLSADEVEIISWYTSDGSALARREAMIPNEDESVYINTEIRKIFDKIEPRDNIDMLYRGTSFEYVPENIGETFKLSNDGLPSSTSLTKIGGEAFDKGVLLALEIEEAKMIIPGAVSAWGTGEHEVLLDGNVEFEVTSIEDGKLHGRKIYHARQVF